LKYVNLGNTDLRISVLGLGTVQLGMPYGYDNQAPPPDEEVIRLIQHSLDLGINFIDTAPGYGRSEMLVGKACSHLATRPIIATKLSITNPGETTLLTGQSLRHSIELSLQQSLKTLGLETLDLVQLHSLSTNFTTPELLDLLAQYTQRGWVRYWGVTTYGEDAPLDALNYPDLFCSLQVPSNALDLRMENKVLIRATKLGVGRILRSIFLQGVLSSRFQTLPSHLASLITLATPLFKVAEGAGIELGELALRFAAFSPYADSAIFGTTSIEELEANIHTLRAGPLPEEVLSAVRTIKVADPSMLDPGNWNR